MTTFSEAVASLRRGLVTSNRQGRKQWTFLNRTLLAGQFGIHCRAGEIKHPADAVLKVNRLLQQVIVRSCG